MKVKSEIVYTLSIKGKCIINDNLWQPAYFDVKDDYLFKEVEGSIHGKGKDRFKSYQLKSEIRDKVKMNFQVRNHHILGKFQFDIENIFIDFNEKLELLILRIVYPEYSEFQIPDVDCLDFLKIVTTAKFYENIGLSPDDSQSIKIKVNDKSYYLLEEDNNYNGLNNLFFNDEIIFENMGDNCAFSINCFWGEFFKEINKCDNNCSLLHQNYKDFIYKLIKVRNDVDIKNVDDTLLENNGQTKYVTELYKVNQLYILNELNFSLCCEESSSDSWYTRRFFDNYSRLIYIALMLKTVFIKYQANKRIIFVIFMRDKSFYNFYDFVRNKYFIFPTTQTFGNLMYQDYLKIFKIYELFDHTFQINDSNSSRLTNVLMFWFVIIQIILVIIQTVLPFI